MTFDIFSTFVRKNLPAINSDNVEFMQNLYARYSEKHQKLYKYLVTSLFPKKSNMKTEFWIDRGWSENEAKEKISSRQRQVAKTISDRRKDPDYDKHFLETYNKIKERQIELGVYDDLCYRKGNSNRWEYYITKINPSTGKLFTENEARENVAKKQQKFYVRMWDSIKNKEGVFFYNTSLEYYINKGMSSSEATKALHERQSTFSLKKCIEKYGKEDGIKKFNARQEKWQSTLNNKSDIEKAEIYKKKLKNFKRYSKSSIDLFKNVQKKLEDEGVILTFYMGENEKFIWDVNGKIYFYDLYVKEMKLIVEYNGVVFHPKPNLSYDELLEWKSPLSNMNGEEILSKDRLKETLALNSGYDFITLWEDDVNAEQYLYDTIITKLNNIDNERTKDAQD